MKKKERGDATATQSRAMSVSARARGQLELSHAHSAYCRLNGEHSNARTEDVDVDDHDEVAEKFWVSNKFYIFFFFCDFVGLELSGTWSPRRRESNALVGYTTGPSSSGWRPAIGFFFHSLLRLTSFLSQYKKKFYIACWLPFCLLGLVSGSGWESRLASS